MRVCGIIAEYNPFHNGHLRQLHYVREVLKADYIVVAMSGDFVQRGEPALLEKYARARMALLSGADLVLELPVSVSTASAEGFASGGVQLLSSLGIVDTLCFGAETEDLPLLSRIACVLLREPEEYRTVLLRELSCGHSFAEAREQALRETMPEETQLSMVLSSPNNILALEYLKAVKRTGSSLQPQLLQRKGAPYHSESLTGSLPSATAIRKMILEGPASGLHTEEIFLRLSACMPESAALILREAISTRGLFPRTGLDEALLYRLFMEDRSSLVRFLDVDEALAGRILHLRAGYTGFSAFAQLIKTRNLALTHVQRALLHILLGITAIPGEMRFARVLGFRERARSLFTAIKEKAPETLLLTKLSDAASILDEDSLSCLLETVRASDLYDAILARQAGRNAISEYSRPLEIIRTDAL